jgi:hypothetical protein
VSCRSAQPNIERLRDALTQRAAEWKQTLCPEPKVARLLLRRLIGPIELYDASKPEWQMPEFIVADAEVKTGLIDGLTEIHNVALPGSKRWRCRRRGIRKYRVASPTGNSVMYKFRGPVPRAA